MEAEKLLQKLGYAESDSFLRAGTAAFRAAAEYGHIYRHAERGFPEQLGKQCEILGVYSLTDRMVSANGGSVPLVYVCRADGTENASRIHRLVWNQDIVPFVLVHTPRGLILHSGFHYERQPTGEGACALRPLARFDEVDDLLRDFSADSIDSGEVWQNWRGRVDPSKRVDWKLLGNLKKLGERLRNAELNRETSHALIGKFVFLHYLRDRGILSERKLKNWGLEGTEVFGHSATLRGVRTCLERVEDWLNGGIFPIAWTGANAPREKHIRAVAMTFAGNAPVGDDLWQLAFEFGAYDFSYIPIETLSVIYEQFLHSPEADGSTKAKDQGAYYTPIPLVNLMLTEIEQRKPIARGTRVFDPSCGSGAFLVQAYRRLIEREFPPTVKKPTAAQLRDLLTAHIFGVDRDRDACGVTELSLALTLLDYVEPPDLEQTAAHKRFQLPPLRGTNVIHADFFASDSADLDRIEREKVDVVVGNPPWMALNPKKLKMADQRVWKWIQSHGDKTKETPVAGNQVAQAFVWRIREFLNDDAEAALLIPAMTLFEDRSRFFRKAIFSRYGVHSVVNFANLAESLFAGRSRVPAAAFFFAPRGTAPTESGRFIRTYAPLVVNQEANRPVGEGKRADTWSLVINEGEIRDIDIADVVSGAAIPWKLAMWGSHRDQRLLQRIGRQFPTLANLESECRLVVSQGLELRTEADARKSEEGLEETREVIGKLELDVNSLKRFRRVFAFQKKMFAKISEERRFTRGGRARLPLSVCSAPHVVVSVARTFAVYSDEDFIVPARQIGIVSMTGDTAFLKALSLYLSSDFAFYHQFLTTSQFGVQRAVATLRALRTIPIPIVELSKADARAWTELHSRLTRTEPRTLDDLFDQRPSLFPADDLDALFEELNERVYDVLKLTKPERTLVSDLVNVRLSLNDGKLGAAAVGPPTPQTMERYARRLRSELDGFVDGVVSQRHNASVVYDSFSGMVAVELVPEEDRNSNVSVRAASDAEARQLAKTRTRLCRKFAQWVYFNRNLRVYEKNTTYILKPMQRFHWTESQAMADAADIISETLAAGVGS